MRDNQKNLKLLVFEKENKWHSCCNGYRLFFFI